jgi:hypothetical protein
MILLQQSDDLGCYTEPAANLLTCALDDLVGAVGGEPQFGTLVGGTLLLSFFLAGDGDLFPPATLVAVLGGLLFPLLPPQFETIAITIVVLGLTGALLSVGEKYVRGGPA